MIGMEDNIHSLKANPKPINNERAFWTVANEKRDVAFNNYAVMLVIIFKFMVSGCAGALGMAWHLDNGFWTILGESLLGWAYVSFKLAQHVFGTTQGLF